MRKIILLICTALLVSGCATQQFYEGEKRKSEELAHITNTFGFILDPYAPVTGIKQIDGKKIGSYNISADVLPGKHEIIVYCSVNYPGAPFKRDFTFTLEAKAGHTYKIQAEKVGARQCRAYLEDVGQK